VPTIFRAPSLGLPDSISLSSFFLSRLSAFLSRFHPEIECSGKARTVGREGHDWPVRSSVACSTMRSFEAGRATTLVTAGRTPMECSHYW